MSELDGAGDAPVSPVNADGSFVDNWSTKYGEENQAHLSRYKDFDSIVNSHIDTKRKLGKDASSLAEIPTDESSDDIKAAWSKALGRPDTNDLYEYKLSDEHATKLGPLSDTKMAAFREFAHGQNWSQNQFKAALDFYHTNIASDIDTADISFKETLEADIAAGKKELKAEWLDGYDDRVLRAQAVMRKYGGDDAVAKFAAQNDPVMLKFLDNIAESMSEDTLKGLKGSGGVTKDGLRARIAENRSQMSAIMKANPVNYKGDPKFRELDKSNIELYKQMPA